MTFNDNFKNELKTELRDEILSALQPRFDQIDKRFDKVDYKLEIVAVQCAENGKAIAKIDRKIDRYYEFERDVVIQEENLKKQGQRIEVLESEMETVVKAIKRNIRVRAPSSQK